MALVKLQIHQHLTENESLVETFPAESWDDFLLIKLSRDTDVGESESLSQMVRQYQERHPGKIVLALVEGMEVEFYGIQEERPYATCSCGHDCSRYLETASAAEEAEVVSDSPAVRESTD